MDKVQSIEEATARLHDGATIMIGGFCSVGTPLKLVEAILDSGVKDLTVISVVNANLFSDETSELHALFANHRIKKFICAHNGTCRTAQDQEKNGELEVEFYPMGTWIEKIRAGGGGLGGVLTPVGLGTLVEQGKQKLTIEGKEYLLELPLRAEIGFIKGRRADPLGNVEYHGVSRNSNPTIAMAADYVVAEVDEIVNIGDIDPERVGTPGVFVHSVVQGYPYREHQALVSAIWARGGALK